MRSLILSVLSIGLISFSQVVSAATVLQASPSSVYFPRTEVHSQSFSEMIYVTNMGGDMAVMMNVRDMCFGDFNVSHNCYFDLYPGQSCTIRVVFAPHRAGYASCNISVNSANSFPLNINLSGQAVDRQ